MSKQAEAAVKDALLVGNFEAAVKCCLLSGNLADALVLDFCSSTDLCHKTHAKYFSREAMRQPFLSLVSAMNHDWLPDFVALLNLADLREIQEVLSTYSKLEEHLGLCAKLVKMYQPPRRTCCHPVISLRR